MLPPGDAALTRRVKSAGPTWTLEETKRGRRYSLGVWAPAAQIEAIRAALSVERSTEAYAKRREGATARRENKQADYVASFRAATLAFLDFAPVHVEIAERLAAAVTEHATPVGSGTVARTQRIPLEKRAESALIAWLRHQTTAYDSMPIPRIKGQRRQVRRMLAEQSRRLLQKYRAGEPVEPASCPLQRALGIGVQPSPERTG